MGEIGNVRRWWHSGEMLVIVKYLEMWKLCRNKETQVPVVQSLMQAPAFHILIPLLSPAGRGWVWLSENKVHERVEESRQAGDFSSVEGGQFIQERVILVVWFLQAWMFWRGLHRCAKNWGRIEENRAGLKLYFLSCGCSLTSPPFFLWLPFVRLPELAQYIGQPVKFKF